ncbi:MAG: glucose-6-phosphate dehydrogenase [Candidatus Liberibacter ctenarytainae]|uniref:Glucose-6-phosphate 1-dehydrogenase n=1 Tax=Candidatus Liberibacter ctenarytainae TaxID=2020335 RepID=A0A937AJ88_9HYPH|nr:glucose-6-phosphate dehydrogenase [Candidatus Liberibacter ctenarytainae]
MLDQITNTAIFDCIIFGGTGDLVKRKLLPALYYCIEKEKFQSSNSIIGVSRVQMTTNEYREFIDQALKKCLKNNEYDPLKIKKFLSSVFYISLDVNNNHGWNDLKNLLNTGKDRIRIFYLAVSSSLFGTISQKIYEHKLITSNTRLAIEKPVGNSRISANNLNEVIRKIFEENQIFRIDHYLGKETVQGLMVLRFANTLYESLWNSHYIDHIQITTAETIGIENRIDYYNKTGALRDMIQNHLLQVLCLVAMEIPSSLDAKSIRMEKLKVLRALETISTENVQQLTIRGQYQSGIVNDLYVKGYLEEIPSGISDTETFVAIKAKIKNWRWSTVPFYLRTGKYLAAHVAEIVISFKPVPHSIFENCSSDMQENKLIIRLQPDGGIKQIFITKDPMFRTMKLKKNALDVCFDQDFQACRSDGYERLIMDIIHGNQTLFMSHEEVEESWRWSDSILKSWENTGQKSEGYAAGTWGPETSRQLIEKDGRKWYENT